MSSFARKGVKAVALLAGPVLRRRPGDVVVLLYHRVGNGRREIDLPVERFEHQLALLEEREHVLDLEGALSRDTQGGVVLTFDDGYRDFHEHVLPLLVSHRLPAVLYLATGLVANGMGSEEALSWVQLREAVASGLITVGSHTHSHADLSRADEPTAEEEMRRSKELIEDRLGVACRHFAYPWGVASEPSQRSARAIFESAALGWGTNRILRFDPHRLARVPVLRSDGPFFFGAKARGLLDGEAVAYRALRRGPWSRR